MGRRRKDTIAVFSDEDSGDGSRPPVQRNCANARERDRMRVLSKGFSRLKTTLPWVPPDTKLSKLDTLRLATCYIAHLRQILAEDDDDVITSVVTPQKPCVQITQAVDGCHGNALSVHQMNNKLCNNATPSVTRNHDFKGNNATDSGYVHPLNLTWPFNFTGRYSVSVPPNDVRLHTTHTSSTRLDQTSQNTSTSPMVTKREIHTS